jgi:hypothetical protein
LSDHAPVATQAEAQHTSTVKPPLEYKTATTQPTEQPNHPKKEKRKHRFLF